MIETKIPKEDIPSIINFLLTIPFFKKLKKSVLKDLVDSMSLISLGGREVLIRQGQLDPVLYILLKGRLRVYVEQEGFQHFVSIAEISVGQMVGEVALLANQPRTGTVRAVRDSLILKLNNESFQKFQKDYPEEVVEIAKSAIKRLLQKTRLTQAGEDIVTIAVAPAGDSDHRRFLHRLIEELNKIKKTILVSQELCDKLFDKKISQATLEDPHNEEISAWLSSLESQYDYVIYETDRQLTPWTRRCLRQADRLLFVADESIYPALNSIEMTLFAKNCDINQPYSEIIFIHPDDTSEITGTGSWLQNRPVQGFHHLRLGVETDFSRLLRFLTGQAIGVVLNGGGMRGFVHAGVLQALEELHIPVDFIGGVSMGALVGASYSKHGLWKMLSFTNEKELLYARNDYTLPLVALLKGKNACLLYKRIFGDTKIEDLWTRFFCISSNVTQSRVEIHDRGLIWLAVRASTAIPAIFPPIYDEEGNMLVDGSIMNNMPVNIMRQLLCGGKILAVNCQAGHRAIPLVKNSKSWISGWKLLFQRLNPFKIHRTPFNSIFTVLHTSLNLSSDEHEKIMEKEADFLLQIDTSDFTALQMKDPQILVEIGYTMALKALPKLMFQK